MSPTTRHDQEVPLQPAIRVDQLVKRYGERAVVDGVSFDVPQGAVVALLGPNGAGKTTTVECIEGFRTPDAGNVRVLGMDPRAQRDEVVARMGIMLQEGGAYPAATPREMLNLYAAFHPQPEPPQDLIRRLGLSSVADRRFRGLSGGEKQRLNLALALIGRPRVVVLDEPTAGMDPHARKTTWEFVRRLRDDGVAVLLTTHFMDEVERLADQVVLLDAGRPVAAGTPAALTAQRPAQRMLVTTPADVDPARLAEALGVPVEADGSGRLIVHAGPDRISAVSTWFADNGVPMTGIVCGGGNLEDVFLRLTANDQGGGR